MRHNDLVIAGQISQCQRLNPNIRSLRFIGYRYAAFQ